MSCRDVGLFSVLAVELGRILKRVVETLYLGVGACESEAHIPRCVFIESMRSKVL